jgi:hypothetical protein
MTGEEGLKRDLINTDKAQAVIYIIDEKYDIFFSEYIPARGMSFVSLFFVLFRFSLLGPHLDSVHTT